MEREITATYRVEVWHRWPDAPEHLDYLRSKHRHVLHVRVTIGVRHNDREVEFHDLLHAAQDATTPGDRGPMSCEDICAEIAAGVRRKYPSRAISVSAFEDGENGATLRWAAYEEV